MQRLVQFLPLQGSEGVHVAAADGQEGQAGVGGDHGDQAVVVAAHEDQVGHVGGDGSYRYCQMLMKKVNCVDQLVQDL